MRTSLLFLLILVIAVFPGTAAAANVSLDIPQEATVDEETTLGVTATVPDSFVQPSLEVVISVSVEGEQIGTRIIDMEPSEPTSLTFSHVFDSGGTKEIEAQISAPNAPIQETISQEIEVVSNSVEDEVSDRTNKSQLDDNLADQSQSINGAVLPLEGTFRSQFESYQSQADVVPDGEASILANENGLHIVVSENGLRTGVATVEGTSAGQPISVDGRDISIFLANEVTQENSPQEVEVNEVLNNPENHQFSLVEINANHRRISFLNKLGEDSEFDIPTTIGTLSESSPKKFGNVMDSVRSLVINSSSEQSSRSDQISSMLDSDNALPTVNLSSSFWKDATSEVTGVVIPSDTDANNYLTRLSNTSYFSTDSVLYSIGSETVTTDTDRVQELPDQKQPVSITVNKYGQDISVKETAEQATSCGSNLVLVPAPSGGVCAKVLQDVVVHTGISWNGNPTDLNNSIPVIGLSSRNQAEPVVTASGRYQFEGEVVEIPRISELTEYSQVFLVYDSERIGNIDTPDQDIISRSEGLYSSLEEQLYFPAGPGFSTSIPSASSQNELDDLRAGETLIFGGDNNTGVRSIMIQAADDINNPTLNVRRVTQVPDSVPSPSSEIHMLYSHDIHNIVNITSSANSESLQSVSIEFILSSSVVSEESSLTVYRYTGVWEELETEVGRTESGEDILITAQSPGFSYFAVAEDGQDNAGVDNKDNSEVDDTSTSDDSNIWDWLSGLGYIVALTVVFSIAFLLLVSIWRKTDWENFRQFTEKSSEDTDNTAGKSYSIYSSLIPSLSYDSMTPLGQEVSKYAVFWIIYILGIAVNFLLALAQIISLDRWFIITLMFLIIPIIASIALYRVDGYSFTLEFAGVLISTALLASISIIFSLHLGDISDSISSAYFFYDLSASLFLALLLIIFFSPIAHVLYAKRRIQSVSAETSSENMSDTTDETSTEFSFIAEFSCGNCGDEWNFKFKKGTKVYDNSEGVMVELPNGEKKRMKCRTCDTSEMISVENREPV